MLTFRIFFSTAPGQMWATARLLGVYTRARLVSATVAVVSILVETADARWAV